MGMLGLGKKFNATIATAAPAFASDLTPTKTGTMLVSVCSASNITLTVKATSATPATVTIHTVSLTGGTDNPFLIVVDPAYTDNFYFSGPITLNYLVAVLYDSGVTL